MKKLDELLKKVEYFEKLAVYSDRKAFLKAIAQDMSVDPNYSPNPDILPPGTQTQSYGPQTTKEIEIKAYPPVDTKIQDKLNQLLVVEKGVMMLIPVDGKLGPKTQNALNLFSKTFGKPATPAAVAAFNSEQNNQAVAKSDKWIPDTKSSGIGQDAGNPRDVQGPI